MDSRYFIKMIFIFSLMIILLSGCPTRVWILKEPPVSLDGLKGSEWRD